MNAEFHTPREYFASANGYGGFKSYFSKIFDSVSFERIFILKGGPGTGKSSLIKKIGAFCKENDLYYEIFRCSSDPQSLDGIIIKDNDVRVAVLDGTAPHERDAEIPGAIDEIINLGAAWDTSALQSKREIISKLINDKNEHYKKAYSNLRYSSVFAANIKAEIKSLIDFNECSKKIDRTVDRFFESLITGKEQIRLLSSFSKYGFKTLSGPANLFKNNYSVFGRYGSDSIFIRLLADRLSILGAEMCRVPSPLDEEVDEAILFEKSDTALFGMGSGEVICDTSELLKIKNIRDFENRIQKLESNKEYYLNLASEELSLASDAHFALENIYTPLMDFSIVDGLLSDMLLKIKNIYSL